MKIPEVYLGHSQGSMMVLFYQKPPPPMFEKVLGTFLNNITNNNTLVGVQIYMFYVLELSNTYSKSTTKFTR